MVHDQSWIACYMLTNRERGTLYTGVTSRFPFRITEHRDGVHHGFTRRYGLHRLVWFQSFELMTAAIQREKTLKKWPRDWKVNLIERHNPHWFDLYPALVSWELPEAFKDIPAAVEFAERLNAEARRPARIARGRTI